VASLDMPADRPAATPAVKAPVIPRPTHITWLTLAFIRSLGHDGGAVCDNPASALGKALLLKYKEKIQGKLKTDDTIKN
jgi:hypothetical protein